MDRLSLPVGILLTVVICVVVVAAIFRSPLRKPVTGIS